MKKYLGDVLDELLHKYIDDEIEFDEIVDFCADLEPNAQNKQVLIETIDCFDIEFLYETLFGRFIDFLTPEEKIKYEKRVEKIFGKSIYSY